MADESRKRDHIEDGPNRDDKERPISQLLQASSQNNRNSQRRRYGSQWHSESQSCASSAWLHDN
jgi:hypothetical protein